MRCTTSFPRKIRHCTLEKTSRHVKHKIHYSMLISVAKLLSEARANSDSTDESTTKRTITDFYLSIGSIESKVPNHFTLTPLYCESARVEPVGCHKQKLSAIRDW